MQEYQNLWDQTLNILERTYSSDIYKEIFFPSKNVVKFSNGLIYVLVPSIYVKTRMNKVYISKINEILAKLSEENLKFKFVIEADIKETPAIPTSSNVERLHENHINENYSFESFVVGDSNKFAYITAMKVAEQPAVVANPLYIFGGVGLGKTHLMQAIGNYILDKDIKTRILYVQAHDFVVDYSKAVQSGNMSIFEKKYDNLDVLLVDDIQMLEIGKKSQQEFFRLFNELYSNQKQIVVTSDCPADQLKGIMDRLTSRFSSGVAVDIKLPELSQRINILRRKLAETSTKVVDDEVLNFIAANYVDNIRELEGALNRVIFYCDIYNADVTLDKAKEALDSLLKSRKNMNKTNVFENVLSVVADFYKISVADVISSNRNSKFVLPRHVSMYILKTKFNLPYKKIGLLLGGRDHTTIMSGCNKIDNEININKELKMAIDSIIKKVE